jgi:hypothetical protein
MSELNSNRDRGNLDRDSKSDLEHTDHPIVLDGETLDPSLKRQVHQLYRRQLSRRWWLILGLWLTVGAYSLWELRYPISLIQEDFTWAAVKYGIAFQPLPSFGLFFCVMMTISNLFRSLSYQLWGIPKDEEKKLAQKVLRN